MRELETNRRQWDERTALHLESAYYDVERFKRGGCTLHRVELEELGDVTGKRLLHLQCHFGLDTLSWARRGARVTGVDFSPEAIAVARELARELRLDASFVCSDVNEASKRVSGPFDIVFTSYGVLVWLPDVARWAATIGSVLEPGGTFYIVEEHPLGRMLVEREGELVVGENGYFDVGPIEVPGGYDYAEPTKPLANETSYQWNHALSEVVTALANAGLRIEFLHEFPFSSWQRLPSMVCDHDGWWRLPGRDDVPFLFSLLGRKL